MSAIAQSISAAGLQGPAQPNTPSLSAAEWDQFLALQTRAAAIATSRWPTFCQLEAAEYELATARPNRRATWQHDSGTAASFDHFDSEGNAIFVYEEKFQDGETYTYELPRRYLTDPDFELHAAARLAEIKAEKAALARAATAAREADAQTRAVAREAAEQAEYRRLAAKYGQGQDPASSSRPSTDPA